MSNYSFSSNLCLIRALIHDLKNKPTSINESILADMKLVFYILVKISIV